MDARAIKYGGVTGFELMTRAGQAAFDLIQLHWPQQPLLIFCGGGNNGGDGYVVAALAAEHGLPVKVWQLGNSDGLSKEARAALDWAIKAGADISPFSSVEDSIAAASHAQAVVVDALLGIGFKPPLDKLPNNSTPPTSQRTLKEAYSSAVSCINQLGMPVLSLDIPSGLCSDTGMAANPRVQATATITFIALKQGLFMAAGRACAGKIYFSDLGVPQSVLEQFTLSAKRVTADVVSRSLPPRYADAHKGDYGHVLVVGGDHGFAGAALMAAEATMRTGAGVVTVATRSEHVTAMLARRPELMVRGINHGVDLAHLLQKASVVAIGPGLGMGEWSASLLQMVLQAGLPVVIDADGLNLISKQPSLWPEKTDATRWAITPHLGEAARLLGQTVDSINANRFLAVKALQRRFGCSVLLKGAGTLTVSSATQPVAVCTTGNPGMATAGMGDVLTGIVAGLMAQGLCVSEALPAAAHIHGAAADAAVAEGGMRGLLATDILPFIRRQVNPQPPSFSSPTPTLNCI